LPKGKGETEGEKRNQSIGGGKNGVLVDGGEPPDERISG